MRGVLADENGRFLLKRKERTSRNELLVEAQLVGLVSALLSDAGVGDLRAIGVGAIGPVDIRTGTIIRPPNLPVRKIEIAGVLRRAFRVPVYVLNDCTAACYGELFFGAGKDLSDLFFVGIGTGIGGGAVVDGRLLLGRNGGAAEIGHIVVDASGMMRCTCGAYGHWEAYCSGKGIPAFLKKWAEEKGIDKCELEEELRKDMGSITAKDVLEACRRGENILERFLGELMRFNAAGLASIINAFDPALISVGGSVALENFDIFIRPAVSFLSSYAFNEVPEVIKSPLGHDAGLYGAVALALRPPDALLKRALYARTG